MRLRSVVAATLTVALALPAVVLGSGATPAGAAVPSDLFFSE